MNAKWWFGLAAAAFLGVPRMASSEAGDDQGSAAMGPADAQHEEQPATSDETRTGGGMMGGGMRGGMMGGGMMGGGMMGGGMMGGGMMGGGMMGGMEDMPSIHGLLMNHEKIERRVEDIPNGVRTVTTSRDPKVAALIREHVRGMQARVKEGRPIRQMDPLFREIFRNHEHIQMKVEDVPGGVRVTETADEPQVTLLIRQHARRAVSEFVEQGMPRAMRPTPLPPGYRPAQGTSEAGGCCCSG